MTASFVRSMLYFLVLAAALLGSSSSTSRSIPSCDRAPKGKIVDVGEEFVRCASDLDSMRVFDDCRTPLCTLAERDTAHLRANALAANIWPALIDRLLVAGNWQHPDGDNFEYLYFFREVERVGIAALYTKCKPRIAYDTQVQFEKLAGRKVMFFSPPIFVGLSC